MLEAARFLFPKVHFGLIDNDCVPVTLFEAQDLVSLAESQFRWPDLVGHYTDPDIARSQLGMLLFTEAHLEYNAGLVISIGSAGRPSPVETTSTAECLAEELADYRHQLLATATPPECPTDASQGGSLFTPLMGVPMENSLDITVMWALYGTFMRHNFWPMPSSGNMVGGSGGAEPAPVKWPKRAHPGALTQAGQEGTCYLRARVPVSIAPIGRTLQSNVVARRTPFPSQSNCTGQNATGHFSCFWKGEARCTAPA